MIRLSNSDGQFEFHTKFLRENLANAWDHSSLQRVANNVSADVKLLSAEPCGPIEWNLKFSDGTSGKFALPPREDKDLKDYPRELWGGEKMPVSEIENLLLNVHFQKGGLLFEHEELMHDDFEGANRAPEQLGQGRANLPTSVANARAKLFEAVHKYGMAMINGVPRVPGEGKRFADSVVGAVETTPFGYSFTIKNVEDPHNLAFHNMKLQHHIDFTYCTKPSDIALFHCIQNADSGGDSLWLDGFAIAEVLRKEFPEDFEVLVNTPVRHMDVTDKWDLQATHPTICLSDSGELERIVFNERTRDSWRQCGEAMKQQEQPQANSEAFYEALGKYEALVENTEWHANTPLQPGQMVLFDNRRVMHSRNKFTGERHMEGSYIEWGGAHATWRSLVRQAAGQQIRYCGFSL